MTEQKKPRALTYTEMMNGGRQQMDAAEHNREMDLQRRTEELEAKVEHLKKSLEECHQPANRNEVF
ncbi:hypothetical protein [Synechococcus sp. UW69]|uniref:hypothetical protein n=1 Tax=Synechococcus sp. UW69 TaxID=368493 RepID=UPI000E0FB98D|nr:hypothetical protein [Synechococcus sp. UW69]